MPSVVPPCELMLTWPFLVWLRLDVCLEVSLCQVKRDKYAHIGNCDGHVLINVYYDFSMKQTPHQKNKILLKLFFS